MPIVSPVPINPLADGRQSDRALLVRRGVQRLFAQMGAAVLPELCLPTGRRADLVALTAKGEIWIVEIKTSVEDFRVDRKWPEYRLHSDRLFFATHPGVPAQIFPDECGFILSDGYGAEIMREAPQHRLSAPLRKSLTLRIARAAAARITAAEIAGVPVPLLDPKDEC
ncbi:MmcB family DNA repair protein [Aliihoeflea sp. 40Bstr573]|uniref:MmcB family DNA repair protein n=1 Tax=Aliihoeflea sp. 40Bstr573 TaxID=2696467 RepID=UPI0020940BCF|nr:MmcB family DNA repair protein [Aliihoeflea sp. 40Bstr573]MCO6387351.1 MmcB family DNA repair protein [Aliihoeflea sp. 40Bstr573]